MLKFTKYHGLGNDFIIINKKDLDELNIPEKKYEDLAVDICHRHTGVGADGLIVVSEDSKVDGENQSEVPVEMIIINSDGSTASMCGNGIRCFAQYCYDEGIVTESKYEVLTGAGVLKVDIKSTEPFVTEVNMGKPDYDSKRSAIDTDLPEFINQKINIPYLMGLDEEKNPDWDFNVSTFFMDTVHTVIWKDESEAGAVGIIGGKGHESLEQFISEAPIFKEQTNVNMVSIIDRDTIEVDTYERGAGPTLACGTGACASVALGIREGKLNKKVNVILPLGQLLITQTEDGNIFMQGPSAKICSGNYRMEK